MGAEILGTLTCPLCGNDQATVHHHQGRKSKLYYRCYTARGGNDPKCGTIQCTGPDGQIFIEKHMTLVKAESYKGPVTDAANDPAPGGKIPKGVKPEEKPAPAPKGGVLDSFIRRFNEEE